MGPNLGSLDRPPHQGLLREEVLALRWLFGYQGDDAVFNTFDQPVAATLSKTKMVDAILLSVDIDSLQLHGDIVQQCHVGISTLDTRMLQALVIGAPDAKPAAEMITSHHYVVGSLGFRKTKSNKFLFGHPEVVPLSSLDQTLESLRLHRDVVLVCHGDVRERAVLEKLGIDLNPLYILDTVKAAQHPLRLSYRYSLEKLLDTLGIPFANLHISGNDAHFVLRALLMLAVKDAESQPIDYVPRSCPDAFKTIAQAPIPLTKSQTATILAKTTR